MKKIIKEIIFSILLTLVLIFILSVLVSKTSISENLIKPITIGIVSFSILVSGFRISKAKKEKGIINGGIIGLIYMLILYILSSTANLDFSLSASSLAMIIFGILGGAIGGILGVNL